MTCCSPFSLLLSSRWQQQWRETVVGVANLSLQSRVTNRKMPFILVGRDRPLSYSFTCKQNFSIRKTFQLAKLFSLQTYSPRKQNILTRKKESKMCGFGMKSSRSAQGKIKVFKDLHALQIILLSTSLFLSLKNTFFCNIYIF